MLKQCFIVFEIGHSYVIPHSKSSPPQKKIHTYLDRLVSTNLYLNLPCLLFICLCSFFFIYYCPLLFYMRPCLNELQKEYCVKTKVIALDWQWVTLGSWCQMNRKGHSSPVKYKVDGKPHKILEKLKITSGKSTLLDFFLLNIFRSPVFTSVFLLIQMIVPLYFAHVLLCVDLIFPLHVDIWWLCFCFGSCQWKRKKTRVSSWFQGKVIFFENQIFNHFYESHWHFFKWYSSHKLSKYLRCEIIFFKVWEKVQKKYFKVGIGKVETKLFFVLFSNACSILKLKLCNQNITKLVYETLLSSNCRAWALKLSEHLKKRTIFSIKS